MTIQRDEVGPGTQWRSSSFIANINEEVVFVYGYERRTYETCLAWNAGDYPEQSWFTYGSDETVTITISLLSSDDITEAVVYPKDQGVTQTIENGSLFLTVPTNVRIRVEVNGDRSKSLNIFSSPLKPEVPASRTDWTTLVRTVSSIDTATNIVTATAHGFTNGQKVALHSDGAYPVATGLSLEYKAYEADVLSVNTFRLLDETGAVVDITSAGAGNLTVVPASYSDTTNALYFPLGEHKLCHLFDIAPGVNVYVDLGALVIGSFDYRGYTGGYLKGPGVISGTFADRDDLEIASFEYAMIYDDPDASPKAYGLEVEGITFVASPFYLYVGTVWSSTNSHLISPWTWNTDGFKVWPKSPGEKFGYIIDCFVFNGDDGYFLTNNNVDVTIRGCVAVTVGNSSYMGVYDPFFGTDGYTAIAEDCHSVYLGSADTGSVTTYPNIGSRAVIHSYVDGKPEEYYGGHNNVTIRNLKVWGPLAARLMIVGNLAYPFSDREPDEQFGLLKNWLFEDIWVEEEQGQLSLLPTKDRYNTIRDFTFRMLTIGGQRVYEGNRLNYFKIGKDAQNLTWDTKVLAIPTSANKGAGMLSELEAVNTMLTMIGSSPVNTLQGTVSADVAAAKHILNETKAKCLMKGWTFNSEYGYPVAPDATGRIRVPYNTLRIDTDSQEYNRNLDPVQRGEWLYNRKDRSYTFSTGFKVEMILDLPWEYLPEPARRFIEASAASTFAARMDVEERTLRRAEQNELMSLTTLQQNETSTGDLSMLSSPTSMDILRRGR